MQTVPAAQFLMAEQVVLQAEKRTVTGKAVRRLRQAGTLPANLTGRKQEAEAIQVSAHEFEKLLKTHGRTTIIRLAIAPSSQTQNAVVRRVSRHPISGAIEHIDFRHVLMNEAMRARVPLHVVGESPAVKAREGILLHLLNDLEVEALPANLPQAIEVDVSSLDAVDAAVHVKDLPLPPNVKVITEGEEPVIKVTQTRAAIEEEAAAAETPEEAEAAPAAEGPSSEGEE
jgi:large subunit ribosomal protein L25